MNIIYEYFSYRCKIRGFEGNNHFVNKQQFFASKSQGDTPETPCCIGGCISCFNQLISDTFLL